MTTYALKATRLGQTRRGRATHTVSTELVEADTLAEATRMLKRDQNVVAVGLGHAHDVGGMDWDESDWDPAPYHERDKINY